MNDSKAVLVLIACLAIAAGTFSAYAQNSQVQQRQSQHLILDQNGDGICDVCGQPVGSGQSNAQGQKAKRGKHFGPGDGTGNRGAGPQDGTGYGTQSGKRMGPQDGSGARLGQTGGNQPGGRRRGRS
jgi:hypothetical protein